MASDSMKVALIGTGVIGKIHLDQWRQVEQAEVVGVFDVSAESARQAAEKFEVEVVYESLEHAVADRAIDAVDICVPNKAHTTTVIAALDAGKHVICEKPLAATSAEIEQMIAARGRAKKLLMTAQHLRFEERSAAFKKMVDAGRLGEIYYARAFWLRRRMLPTTHGFIRKEQSGGGPCLDIGVHVLDLALHFMGFPKPISVTGVADCKLAKRAGVFNEWGEFDPADLDVEDFAAGMIRFENGAALTLEVSWMLNMDEDETYGVHLFGNDGGGRWPELRFSHEHDGLLIDERISNIRQNHGHRNELREFTQAVRDGGPSPVAAEESLVVARILEALYASAEQGSEAEL